MGPVILGLRLLSIRKMGDTYPELNLQVGDPQAIQGDAKEGY